jgi:hypothetical protein
MVEDPGTINSYVQRVNNHTDTTGPSTSDAEITELAKGLKYDPALMYKFVHDHIRFIPTWGETKGAYMTWMDRSGNGFDQASLLVGIVSAQSNVRGTFTAGANFVLYRPISPDRARASLRAASHLIRRDKRRHPRMPVHAQASVSYPAVENAPATLIDLSEEGLALQCEQRLPTKTKVYFRFNLPGQLRWIQLAGETVWQDSSGRAGIRFVQVPHFARLLLQDWLGARALLQQSKVTIQMPPIPAAPSGLSASDRREKARHACQLGVEVYRLAAERAQRSIALESGKFAPWAESMSGACPERGQDPSRRNLNRCLLQGTRRGFKGPDPFPTAAKLN